jgi:hypothetical protein
MTVPAVPGDDAPRVPSPPEENTIVRVTKLDGSVIESPPQQAVAADTQKHRLLGEEMSRQYADLTEIGWLPDNLDITQVADVKVV